MINFIVETRRLSMIGFILARSTEADAKLACSGPWSRHATPTMKHPIHTALGGDLRPAIFVTSLSIRIISQLDLDMEQVRSYPHEKQL